jgi:hypothetical protein
MIGDTLERMRGFALVVAFVSGCSLMMPKDTRPPLPPPVPRDAPYEYRYAQYGAARATKVDRDYIGWSTKHGRYSSPYLLLANGRKVWNVDELAPHIAAETDLGHTLTARKHAHARERRIYVIGFGSIAAGAVFFGLGALAQKSDGPIPSAVPFTLGAAGLFGGLGYLTFAKRLDEPPAIVDDDMLARYNASLAESLSICVDGLAIRDCADYSSHSPAWPHWHGSQRGVASWQLPANGGGGVPGSVGSSSVLGGMSGRRR